MDIYSAGILVSILIYVAIGNYAGRKVKHLEDYFVAGRQAPTLLIVGTFTLYSGSRGVILTDTLMFLLFGTVSFLALFYIVDAQGGWLTVLEGLTTLEEKPELMNWYGIVGPGLQWETPTDFLIWSIQAAHNGTGYVWSL